MDNKPDKIIVHHSADSFNQKQFQKVNEWHKQKGFEPSKNGIYCGYHVFIEKDGSSVQVRDYNERGQHCTEQNQLSIGIGLAGNFDIELPTEKQKETLAQVCKFCMSYYKIPITRIYPHRAYKNTSCYGSKLNDKWAATVVLEYELNFIKKILLWIQIQLKKR